MSIFSIFYFNQFSDTWFFLTLNGDYFKWIGDWLQVFSLFTLSKSGRWGKWDCVVLRKLAFERIWTQKHFKRMASLLLVDCYIFHVPCGLTVSQDGASRMPWDLSFNRWGVIACCLAEDLGIRASLFDFLFGHVLSQAHILTLHDVGGPKDMASAEFQAYWIHTGWSLKTVNRMSLFTYYLPAILL